MNRRNFLAAAAACVAIPSIRAEDDASATEPKERFTHEDIVELKAITVKSEDGKLQLSAAIIVPEEPDLRIKKVKLEDGETEVFYYKGEKLEDFWHTGTVLTKFEFSWDGRKIPIPEKQWKYLTRLRIDGVKVERSKLSEEERILLEQFFRTIRRPHVSLSNDGTTALIEWERGEECDSSSTFRWMISKSGTVLGPVGKFVCGTPN